MATLEKRRLAGTVATLAVLVPLGFVLALVFLPLGLLVLLFIPIVIASGWSGSWVGVCANCGSRISLAKGVEERKAAKCKRCGARYIVRNGYFQEIGG